MQSNRRNPFKTPQAPRMDFTQDTQTQYENIERMLASTPQPEQQKKVWISLKKQLNSFIWVIYPQKMHLLLVPLVRNEYKSEYTESIKKTGESRTLCVKT